MEDLIYAEGQSPPKTAISDSLHKLTEICNIVQHPLSCHSSDSIDVLCPGCCRAGSAPTAARGKAKPQITPEHVEGAGTGSITP